MNHKDKYYGYQTSARGLLDGHSLEKHFKKLEKWYWARLKNHLPSDMNSKCLDVPCGYGNFLYFLRSKGYKNIYGYDLDASQIKLAHLLELPAETKDIFAVLADSQDSYDLISSIDFIEHISKDDALKFLELCKSKLNENGILILRTPCADGPFGSHDANNDITHEWSMTSNVLKGILEMSGFSRVKILDERPQPTSFIETIRWLIFFPSRLIANLLCIGLGMRPPRVWSRSMIAVAYK
jgi:2-polyprenyl-3-methyl-5-hydroxy-6-metoxy-1,4-benzoquinol methylase